MRLNPEQRVVHCEDGDIPYLLTRKSVKNVNLRIKPEGEVLVSANNSVPTDFIDAFIEKKQRYIFSVLSKTKETSEKDCAGLFSVPLKITSCMLDPRKVFALCSPITQRIASATLLFPQPLGPTIPVTPDSKLTTILSAKDLNPCISILLNFNFVSSLEHILTFL